MGIQKKLKNVYTVWYLLTLRKTLDGDPKKIKADQNRRIYRLMKKAYKIPVYREKFEQSGTTPEDYHSASEPKWAEPIALTQPDLETFPVDALPKTIADIVEAAAESLQVSPDMPAVCALGALSVCIQKKYAVRIHDD